MLNDSGSQQISSNRETEENSAMEKSPILVDGHVDLTYFLMNLPEDIPLSGLEYGPFTLKKIREVGLRLFSNAIYCEDKFNGEASLRHLKETLQFTLSHFDEVTIIEDGQDLEGIKKEPERIGTLLLLENADGLVGNLSFIEGLMETGIRIVGLTHRDRNGIGDGDGVLVPGGFSLEGIEVIRALDDHALIIDVAHLHPKCFWKLLDIFNGPLISSHTGIRKVCDIQRNIHMEQAKEIINRGGLVGVTFNPEMVAPAGRASLEHIFVHVDVLVQRFGPERVGIAQIFAALSRLWRAWRTLPKCHSLGI